jgi:hypothetical protein
MLSSLSESSRLKLCKYCQTKQPEASFEACAIIKLGLAVQTKIGVQQL